jgi:hypothetical protein
MEQSIRARAAQTDHKQRILATGDTFGFHIEDRHEDSSFNITISPTERSLVMVIFLQMKTIFLHDATKILLEKRKNFQFEVGIKIGAAATDDSPDGMGIYLL